MKIAIIGTRSLRVSNIENFLPPNCSEIVSGGAKGVDSCAAEYAIKNKIKLVEFLPEYEKYGRAAPIIRNRKIADYADIIIAFWNGKSNGTKTIIEYCKKTNKSCKVIIIE